VKNIRVFKFGGASVKNSEAVRNVGKILQSFENEQIVVVVSAMGKTTNALEKIVDAHFKNTGEAAQLFEDLKNAHYKVCLKLFEKTDALFEELNDLFVEIEWVLEEEPHENFDFIYDQVVSIGELVSTKISGAYLNQIGLKTQWIDARDIVRTNDLYREAWVDWDETEKHAIQHILPILKSGNFVITQGFIGSTSDNFSTTLGREGSDYTAAILSYCLNAESMTIWKDVPGVLTADPAMFENVTKLDRLSYMEAIEMTYYGAKVIHPKTIKPLQNKSIPLYVKSFAHPENEGTRIFSTQENNYPPIVAVELNQALLSISTRDFSFVAVQHMSYLFQKIADIRLQVNMMQNTAISFAICVNDVDDRVERFAEEIKEEFDVEIDRNLELISVRHYQNHILENLKNGKIVLLEERLGNTVQMVVKDIPVLKRKS